jgi:hypothetical protein
MKSISEMTEEELQKEKVPTFDNIEDLTSYIEQLKKRSHDYGTCCYAMSMSAVAAFNYIASALDVSGFQASCAGLDILKRTRDLDFGFQILDFKKLMYPQYVYNKEYFPNSHELIEKHKAMLQKKAIEMLEENKNPHPDVKAHWERLASLK